MSRYYISIDSRHSCLIDDLRKKVLACVESLAHQSKIEDSTDGLPVPVAPERMEAICNRLNLRDYGRRRQYGEPRADFAKRIAAKIES